MSAEDFETHFGGTGFSDFFEQIVRLADARRERLWPLAEFSPEDFAERGRDIEGDIMVTLEEAMRGSVRTVTVRHENR